MIDVLQWNEYYTLAPVCFASFCFVTFNICKPWTGQTNPRHIDVVTHKSELTVQ